MKRFWILVGLFLCLIPGTGFARPNPQPAPKPQVKVTAHTATVTCAASPDATAGYFFYGGNGPGLEATAPLNSTPVATCAYTDTAVTVGETRYYKVTAAASNGSGGYLQSPMSAESNGATILPAAPGTPVAVGN